MNTFGTVVSTRNAEMDAFDRLPAAVRRAVTTSPLPYSTVYLLEVWTRAMRAFNDEAYVTAALLHLLEADASAKLAATKL